jgi:chromosome segregation ATPase
MNTEENEMFAQESMRLTDSGNDNVPTITSLLNEYTDRMEQIEKLRLAEQRREHEMIQAELRKQKDSALSDLNKAQALTNKYREELDAKVTEEERLTEKVKALEKQLGETATQLSDATKENAAKEKIWNSVLGSLARLENENNEIREQLKELKQQLERTYASIAEERANSDRNLSELTSVRDKLAEEQLQRAAVERRLNEQDYRVTLLSNRIINLKTRKLQLRFELNQARMEAEQVNPLRSANEELEARCETLTREVSDLNDIRHHHEDEIRRVEQQQDTMSLAIDRLSSEVTKEQMRRTQLQSTVSDLEQERHGLNNQLQQLRADYGNLTDALTNAHAAARHAEIRMRWLIFAHRARCRLLKAEIAELKSSRLSPAKAKSRLALVKYKDSPAKP